MEQQIATENLFDRRLSFPDPYAQGRLGRLIGIDEQKNRLAKTLGMLINPDGLRSWSSKFHPQANTLIETVLRKPPLIILAGDVGTGKTELAETISDAVARQEGVDITLFPLSLATRGSGRVGEMTSLVSAAFNYTFDEAKKLHNPSGKSRGGVVLLIDEADALVQSRETDQMHHEDRAGVNAFIRGVDRIAEAKLPAAVIMCTNRLSAIDPAVKRRAADILKFNRPNDAQRKLVLEPALTELGLSGDQVKAVINATGNTKGRQYGCTFSDLTQRLLPNIVINAYPNTAVTFEGVMKIANDTEPTPPFRDE